MKPDSLEVENPQAFPWLDRPEARCGGSGMDLRDWFAGQALTMINPDAALEASRRGVGKTPAAFIAALAYELADAMLRARQQGVDRG
jgi:hypothetical protein